MSEKEKSVLHEITRIEVGDYVVGFYDLLRFDPAQSKIGVNIARFDEGHNQVVETVGYSGNADKIKLALYDILNFSFARTFNDCTVRQAKSIDGLFATAITINDASKKKGLFWIQIKEGAGGQIPSDDNEPTHYVVHRPSASLDLIVRDTEMRGVALTILDYIRHWELVFFRQRRDGMAIDVEESEVPNSEIGTKPGGEDGSADE